MKKFLNKIFAIFSEYDYNEFEKEINNLRARIDYIQNRTNSYYTNRWNAVDNIADYLVGAEIDGDYLEFGVYQGTTFSYAYKIMHPLFSKMRFFAFDSFSGLPEIKGMDAIEGYKSSFYEGQFAFSEESFIENVKKENVDLSKVVTIKGWFNDTLTNKISDKYNINKISFAWIDCDLYESTVPVLNFLTDKIVTGTVIVFDDWRCFRNLPSCGEQKACNEWLERNPDILLHELTSFGFHGIAFTVERINKKINEPL
jgi:O-methyltransferase